MTEKLQEHFRMTKEFPYFAKMENYNNIMLRQSGQWLNEIAETLSLLAKFLRLLRFFDCTKTRAMSKFCHGISQ